MAADVCWIAERRRKKQEAGDERTAAGREPTSRQSERIREDHHSSRRAAVSPWQREAAAGEADGSKGRKRSLAQANSWTHRVPKMVLLFRSLQLPARFRRRVRSTVKA